MSYFTTIKIEDSRVLQSDNSSVSPLTATTAFTGATTDTLDYKKVCISIATDQDGTANVQQSSDGTHWDFSDSLSVTGGTPVVLRVQLDCRYTRVVYTNGAVDQAYLRLQTVFEK